MSESFLTLMADLDESTQEKMKAWYHALTEAGFKGTQTPNLPYHISLATFPLDAEAHAAAIARQAAETCGPTEINISHIGIFAPGKVLFSAPEINNGLSALHKACEGTYDQPYLWTPHITMLIDETETICAALPVYLKSFVPMTATITHLHLCAFWPTREILTVPLTGKAVQ